MAIAISALVLIVKRSQQTGCEGHIQFIALSSIANINTGLEQNPSTPILVAEILFGRLLQLGELGLELSQGRSGGGSPEHSARIVLTDVADQNAERREAARHRGHDHARNSQGLRQFTSVQAARSAERYEGKLAWIIPSFDRNY